MRNDQPCRQSLYAEVTRRIIAELEQGRVPWAQAWDQSGCGCAMPANAVTGHRYSGINVLILWAAGIAGHRGTQRWLTCRQAAAAGGYVRRGEKGITICYAGRFAPRREVATAGEEGQERHEAKKLAFSRRFAVFNVDQCVGLPAALTRARERVGHADMLPAVATLIEESGAEFRIGGDHAFYARHLDVVVVPPPAAFREPANWYRTALHELGHWTGHPARLDRNQRGAFGSAHYAKEELVAELAAAFTCATLNIRPTVRHADYIASWLDVLRSDDRAIFRAARKASKAADYLLAFAPETGS